MVTIKDALRYPFANWKRMFNYFWLLVPIWGWFVVSGYVVRVIREITRKGSKNELPAIHPFEGLFTTGLFVAVTLLILGAFLWVLMLIPYFRWLAEVYFVFIFPLLVIQFAATKKPRDGLDVLGATNTIFTHFGSYLLTYFKTIIVIIVYLIASIPLITLIVTLPGIVFSSTYLFVDFYRGTKSTHPADVVAKAISKKKRK